MTVNISPGPARTEAGRDAGRRRWLPLALTLTGTFMIVLDFFIVSVAIPSMQRDLHAGPAAIEWVVTAYGLTYGVGLITGGRLGDRYGRRRMFVLGLALFTLASLACGVAGSAAVLIASRAVQGIGAAIAGPQTLSLIGVTYAGRDRVKAVTAYGVTLGLAAVLGQLFGGALIQAGLLGLGWRTCFLANLPIGLAALIAAPRLLAESRGNAADRLDLAGTALVTAGLIAVILPLVEGRQQHWPAWAWLSLAASVPIFGVFAAHLRGRLRRGRTPLVDLTLLADRTVSAGLLATAVFYCAMASFFVILALYLQDGRGMSALGSGAMFTAAGAGYLASSMVPARLIARLGRQWPALGGLVMAAGLAALRAVVTHGPGDGVLALTLPLLVTGIGMGMLTAPLTGIVLARVAPRHAGTISGLQATTVQVGNSVGVAVIGVVFFGALGGGVAHAFATSLVWLAALPLAASVAVQFVPRERG
jgi:EmrB/QacA subfamily drug resistance transporter